MQLCPCVGFETTTCWSHVQRTSHLPFIKTMHIFCTPIQDLRYGQVFLESLKFFLPHLYLVPPLPVTPLEYFQDVRHQKTRFVRFFILTCSIVFVIVLLQPFWQNSDLWQTETQTKRHSNDSIYCRWTAQCTMLVNLCYVSRAMAVMKVSNSKCDLVYVTCGRGLVLLWHQYVMYFLFRFHIIDQKTIRFVQFARWRHKSGIRHCCLVEFAMDASEVEVAVYSFRLVVRWWWHNAVVTESSVQSRWPMFQALLLGWQGIRCCWFVRARFPTLLHLSVLTKWWLCCLRFTGTSLAAASATHSLHCSILIVTSGGTFHSFYATVVCYFVAFIHMPGVWYKIASLANMDIFLCRLYIFAANFRLYLVKISKNVYKAQISTDQCHNAPWSTNFWTELLSIIAWTVCSWWQPFQLGGWVTWCHLLDMQVLDQTVNWCHCLSVRCPRVGPRAVSNWVSV